MAIYIQIFGFIIIGLVAVIIVVVPYYCENDPKAKENAHNAMIVFFGVALFALGLLAGKLSVIYS
jgi:hypothetical protein